MTISMIHITLEFSGALLLVETNEQEQMVVPLKPISDAIGLEWECQRKKVSEPELAERLGTCVMRARRFDQGRDMVFIRFDRVAAFLNNVNPRNVRGQGNESTATFLFKKQAEWDDLIDFFELNFGVLTKSGKVAARKPPSVRDFLSVLRAKKQADSEPKRKRLHMLARKIAEDLGTPFQGEILDSVS